MANQWLRLWHEMPNDPKWRTIARNSGQPIGNVMSVYLHLLVSASNATERGRTQNICADDLASALEISAQDVESILSAMQGKVLDGEKILGWEKRQPLREDGAADRGKSFREKKKMEERIAELERLLQQQTQPNADERKRALDKDKEEDKEDTTASSSSDDLLACPVGSLINLYHECMPMNPQVKVLNEARRKAIRQRWKEAAAMNCKPFGYSTKADGLEAWRQFFEVCAESDFLTGRAPAQPGKPPFVADIDFLFSPSGFAKTLENKYHREAA